MIVYRSALGVAELRYACGRPEIVSRHRRKETGTATYSSHYFSVRSSLRIVGRFRVQPVRWEVHVKDHLYFLLVVGDERDPGGSI